MPWGLVANHIIMLTVETAVCRVTALRHIPRAFVFVVAKWVAVTDVVWAGLPILVDTIFRAYPVAHIGIVVTATLWCVLLTGTRFRCAEEAAHGIIALLIAIWAV